MNNTIAIFGQFVYLKLVIRRKVFCLNREATRFKLMKLFYDYETKKWNSIGVSSECFQSNVSPIKMKVKRTVDVFAVVDYAYGLLSRDLSPIYISSSIPNVLGLEIDKFSLETLISNIPERNRKKIGKYKD